MKSTGDEDSRAIHAGNTLHTVLLGYVLVGLAFSSMLLGEYRSGGLLCSTHGGCDAVRASAYSSIAGVSVPLIGVAYFLGLLACSALPRLTAARLPLALAGALAGVTFIGLQALVIGALCPLCLVVDLAAIGAGGLAWMSRGVPTPEVTPPRGPVLSALTVAALSLVWLGEWLAPMENTVVKQAQSQLPGEVARAQEAEGAITVVEYIDFECSACRLQHRIFKEVLAEFDHDVRVAYLHSPLPTHPHAEDAARAYICVEGRDIAKDMADKLLTLDDISLPAIERIATELGLDVPALRQCMSSEATTARLERDQKLAEQIGVHSLPIFWIGRQKFIGAFDSDRVRQALELWVSEREH